jgi:hypothetical protein
LHLVLSLRGSIGEFEPTPSLGREYLVAGAASLPPSAVRDLVGRLAGSAGTPPRVIEEKQLAVRSRSSLIARIEQARQIEPAAGADFKLRLEMSELRELVDDRSGEVDRLIELLGQPSCCKVWLRRTEAASDQVIAFHRDVSRRTLQVPLNDPAEYDGGRLVFATATGELLATPRTAGSATLHDCSVVHGVTELTRGMRYALFLLDEPVPA